MKITHLINPITPRPGSDIDTAQPITLESLKRAVDHCDHQLEIEIISAQYPEDSNVIPKWIFQTSDLVHSSLEHVEFLDKRKLPKLSDLWDRLLLHSTESDVVIYSNIDIAIQPHFYQRITEWIQQGYDAISVTRRTIPKTYQFTSELDLMYSEIGQSHPGDDCFIIKRDTALKMDIKPVYVGVAFFDKILLINCAIHADSFLKVRDERLTFHIGDDQTWLNPKAKTVAYWNKQQLSLLIQETERVQGPLYNNQKIWPHVSSVYELLGFHCAIDETSWFRRFGMLKNQLFGKLFQSST